MPTGHAGTGCLLVTLALDAYWSRWHWMPTGHAGTAINNINTYIIEKQGNRYLVYTQIMI